MALSHHHHHHHQHHHLLHHQYIIDIYPVHFLGAGSNPRSKWTENNHNTFLPWQDFTIRLGKSRICPIPPLLTVVHPRSIHLSQYPSDLNSLVGLSAGTGYVRDTISSNYGMQPRGIVWFRLIVIKILKSLAWNLKPLPHHHHHITITKVAGMYGAELRMANYSNSTVLREGSSTRVLPCTQHRWWESFDVRRAECAR